MAHKHGNFPACSCCLAACALLAHLAALGGNLSTVASLESLGKSTDGWSAVGTGLAGGLSGDLSHGMSVTAEGMTMAVKAWSAASRHFEDVHTAGHALLLHENTSDPAARKELTGAAAESAQALQKELEQLLEKIKPVLQKVDGWLETFGERMQHAIEDFSMGLDIAQKLFDSVTAQLSGGEGYEEEMQGHAYELFDVSNTGDILLSDLQAVSEIYHITALQGEKAKELFRKYDPDDTGAIDRREFALLVGDVSIPGAMSTVLRAYARRLAEAAGEVASAKTREEVARGVAEYVTVICAKNQAKVGWMAQAFTNSSLPVEFAAVVLAQLAMAKDTPGQLTTVNVGKALLGRMVELGPESAAGAVKLLVDAKFWESEGLDLEKQASVAEEVSSWAASAKDGHLLVSSLQSLVGDAATTEHAGHGHWEWRSDAEWQGGDEDSSLLQLRGALKHNTGLCEAASGVGCSGAPKVEGDGGVEDELMLLQAELPGEEDEVALLQSARPQPAMRPSEVRARDAHRTDEDAVRPRPEALLQLRALPSAARQAAERSRDGHERHRRAERARRRHVLAGLQAASVARGVGPGLDLASVLGGSTDPEAERVVNANAVAQPETLRFASWLAANASSTARNRQELCFSYSAQSSSTADSTAQRVSKVVKRFRNVLNAMAQHTTPDAITRLEEVIQNTTRSLEDLGDALAAGKSTEALAATARLPGANLTRVLGLLSAAWDKAAPVLEPVMQQLPTCIKDLQRARKQVSGTAASLDLLFGVFGAKAPPIFADVSRLFRVQAVVYFAVWCVLTLALLYYAFYKSGYMDEEQEEAAAAAAAAGAEYEPPRSFRERCHVCYLSALSCVTSMDDSEACFWSVVLLLEVIWLLCFVVVAAMLILCGVRAFVAQGCKPVYILGDAGLCTESLQSVSKWLGTEQWIDGQAIASACGERDLLVCQTLGQQLGTSMLLTCLGDLLAAVLSFWLILESAVMHERRRWRVMCFGKEA